MNGRDLLLILTHLFRKVGSPVKIADAVEFLSFRCRYGSPSQVRRMLTFAVQNEMISRIEDSIEARFLYDRQALSHNIVTNLRSSIRIDNDVEPMF